MPYGEAALRFGCHRWEQKAPKTAPLLACAGLSAEVRRRSRTNVHSEATMEHCCAELADALISKFQVRCSVPLYGLAVYLNKVWQCTLISSNDGSDSSSFSQCLNSVASRQPCTLVENSLRASWQET